MSNQRELVKVIELLLVKFAFLRLNIKVVVMQDLKTLFDDQDVFCHVFKKIKMLSVYTMIFWANMNLGRSYSS